MEETESLPASLTLQRAVLKSKKKASGLEETASFKINPSKKEIASKICTTGGTTLSEFLRQHIDDLIEEYIGPKRFKELELEIENG